MSENKLWIEITAISAVTLVWAGLMVKKLSTSGVYFNEDQLIKILIEHRQNPEFNQILVNWFRDHTTNKGEKNEHLKGKLDSLALLGVIEIHTKECLKRAMEML